MRVLRGIVLGGLLIALLPTRTSGQTTFAALTGIVTDSAGGVVPGATVEARHVRSNYTYTTTTNEAGHYTIGQLREGEYVLRLQLAGFKEFVAQDIQLAYIDNGAGHDYHSLTIEVERRYARGLAYQFSYVLPRDIGDLERSETAENAFDRRRERGDWLDIPRHRISGYELPFGNGKPLLTAPHPLVGALAGGWEVTVAYQLHSGQFLTPLWTGPDPTGTAFTTSGTPAQVTIRPNQLSDPNLPASQRTTNRWFDPAAFESPTPGSFGTAAKGIIHGPGSKVWDVGVAKHFDRGGGLRMRWELTATNILNTPNWSNPGTNISSLAQVGVISGVGEVSDLDPSGPRSFRMGIRLDW